MTVTRVVFVEPSATGTSIGLLKMSRLRVSVSPSTRVWRAVGIWYVGSNASTSRLFTYSFLPSAMNRRYTRPISFTACSASVCSFL